jgi:hypothetical protein
MARVALESFVHGIDEHGSYIMHVHDVGVKRTNIARVRNCPACRMAVKLRFEPILEKINERFDSVYKPSKKLNANTKHFVDLQDVRKRFTFKADLLDTLLDRHETETRSEPYDYPETLWEVAESYYMSTAIRFFTNIESYSVLNRHVPNGYSYRAKETREHERHAMGANRSFKSRQYQPNGPIRHRLHHA